MKKIIVTLLVFVLLFSVPLIAEKVIIRIDNPGRATAAYFMDNNYDIASYYPEKYIDIFPHEDRVAGKFSQTWLRLLHLWISRIQK